MKTFEQIAQSMHDDYRANHIHKLAEWHQLTQMHRDCWIAAAKAAHKEITEVQLMKTTGTTALILADYLEESPMDANEQRIVEELRRLHARNQELEAMLETVGAGGVSAQRVTQGVQAEVKLPEPTAWIYHDAPTLEAFLNNERRGLPVNSSRVTVVRCPTCRNETPLFTEQQVRELLAKDLDAVNLDRLGKALTKLGHATWVSQEEAAADIPRWVNALTRCVLEIPEAAPQPQAAARDAERWGSEPVTGTPFLQEEDQHLLDRFIETTEDNEGFDIGKDAIKRLAHIGVVESLGLGRYGVTMFGYWVHEHHWHQNPSLPLKTNLDRDADARAAIAAAKEMK